MKIFFWKHKNIISALKQFRTSPKKRRKVFRYLLIYFIYFVLAMIFSTAISFAWFSKDLPTPSRIANSKPAESTKLFDRTGQTLLYETGEQKRTIVKSDQISQYLKDATISTEDANFYKHHGIDVKEILSAVASKMLGRTDRLRGASTITQQYVKNSLLTSDRSIVRKIKEAILAVELEFMFKKDEILTMYLNEIPYGNAAAGAEAGSQMYYGKSAKDLTLAQAATLAAIPQAPTYYSPYGTHIDRLIARRNYVLDQMVKNSKISAEQAIEAKKEDTTTLGVALKPRKDSMLAPHFAMYVLEQIAAEYGEDVIQKEGLKITTTLDYDKQKIAQDAVTAGAAKLEKYGGTNAALVAIDPKTGQILSMVGSKDYFDVSIDGNVNVADSARQPGSSFKPIAYATAFKKPDFSPSRILFDLRTDFGGGYNPQDYNGKTNGAVTMRQALSNSLNIPAVKVMSLAGIDNVLKTAEDLGITTLTQRDRYGLSLVLGAGEVTPIEMAGAFSVFATGGVKNDLTPVLKIQDSSGKTLYDYDKEKKNGRQVLDPQVAYEISNILSDNNARALIFGTRSALAFSNRTVAAKTGTTSDFKDAWTVGFTPSIAVAIWTGNSDATAMKTGADGSVIAAPIFHTFIEKALANVPNEEFTVPAGIQTVTVERYSNKLPGAYSSEFTTDIFADWQVPKDKDDIHKYVKVCRGTNKLAPSDAPEGLIEEKMFLDLHSERPDNPNWENPVLDWIRGMGIVVGLPTETCNPTELMPAISFVNPTDGTTASGLTNIEVQVSGSVPIQSVEYFIDGVSIGKVSAAPYSSQFNFSSLTETTHKLSAIVMNNNSVTVKTEISIKTTDIVPPIISNITSSVSSSSGISALVSFLTNEPANGLIKYWVDGSSTVSSKTASDLTMTHQITIGSLAVGKKYFFTITSSDAKNNSTTSAQNSFQTP